MQALRAAPLDPAVAQLLETKQCVAEQTRAALHAVRPIRTQLKAAVESRDMLMKKHAAVADGVQSLVAQTQAKQAELAELANALRDKVHLVAQLQERVRAEELAAVPPIHIGSVSGSMSAAQWAEGLATALAGSQAASRRAADEGLRSIGDAALSHRPCRGRAISRSPSHSPGWHRYKRGRHFPR